MGSISKFETDLWAAADNLRANSKLTSVDAEKIKTDRRLPFGLSGLNKDKKVSHGRSKTINLWGWAVFSPHARVTAAIGQPPVGQNDAPLG